MQEVENMNDKFSLDMVSIRLITDKKLYSDTALTSPEKAVSLIGQEIASFDREAVAIINCSTALKPINAHIVSIGSINESIVSPREVFKAAILSNAAAFLIMHNHPSGVLKPSMQDYIMTGNLLYAGELMSTHLVDHIIVGYNNGKLDFHSFKENDEFNIAEDAFKRSSRFTKFLSEPSQDNIVKASKNLSEVLSKYKSKEPHQAFGEKEYI